MEERPTEASGGGPLPPTYVLLALLAMVALHFTFPWRRPVRLPWRLCGVAPLLLGIAVNLKADRAFKERATTVKPFQPSKALVVDGAYGLSRHPMYLGYVLILVGVATLLRSLSPWLLIPPFALWMAYGFIRVEERMMAERFGPAYAEYRTHVRRWL